MSDSPPVPTDLVDACANKRCVLFVGSAMCAYAGLPNRLQLMTRLLADLPGISEDEREKLRSMLDQATVGSGLDDVGEVLTARFAKSLLFENVQRIYGSQPPVRRQAFSDLRDIGFRSALTNNWDTLLEDTFADQLPIVLTGSQNDPITRALRSDAFFIAKLFGDLADEKAFRFTAEDYRLGMYVNQTLAKIITSNIQEMTIFFLGVSLQGIQNFFLGLPWRLDRKILRNHALKSYALVPRAGLTDAPIEKFRARYSIELLPFEATPKYEFLEAFVSELRDAVRARNSDHGAANGNGSRKPLTLDRVVLKNIGTFENADFSISENWTVLLGNNGLGKSTILRAIALGLCGDDRSAAAVADKILRVGTKSGTIQLHVGESVYSTYLTVDGPELRVETHGVTPVQRGDWVVLGFPSLRGIGAGAPEPVGLIPSSGSPVPAVADLLPLLSGAPDLRLQNLRTWIAFFDHFGQSAKRVKQQRRAFFSILEDLMPEAIEFSKLEAGQVYVRTLEGIIPIDQLSQGMMSLLGWIGTTLQRMYEIYPHADWPERQPGLVLVDEIDAHLHPEWQQTIVPLVKKHFPLLQVVATTHSALIALSLDEKEVQIVRRVGDKCVVEPAPEPFEGLRADQMLTSPMFGLRTTRSDKSEERINEYSLLIGLDQPTQEQRARLVKLRRELSPLRSTGETPIERRVDATLEVAVDEIMKTDAMRNLSAEELKIADKRIREIVAETTSR